MKQFVKKLVSLLLVLTVLLGSSICLSTPTFAGSKKVYLGKYTCTAYCGCRKCNGKYYGCRTASGTKPKAGRTIAVDPRKIKLKSKVMINGRVYTAEDTGGAIKGKKIDIFFSTHKKCKKFGRKKMKVYRLYGGSEGGSSDSIDDTINDIESTTENIINSVGDIVQLDAIKVDEYTSSF